jgi:hypothetical protein
VAGGLVEDPPATPHQHPSSTSSSPRQEHTHARRAFTRPKTTDPAAGVAPSAPRTRPGASPPIEIPTVSIIDTILQLDDFLSGDVRRAEKTARFCAKPWLEAEIDELAFELEQLTTPGQPLPGRRASLGEQVRTAQQVALEIQTKQAEYGAAFVSVRMGQLSSDDWKAWRAKWREVSTRAPATPTSSGTTT